MARTYYTNNWQIAIAQELHRHREDLKAQDDYWDAREDEDSWDSFERCPICHRKGKSRCVMKGYSRIGEYYCDNKNCDNYDKVFNTVS